METGIRFHVLSAPAVPEPVFNRDPIKKKSQIDFAGKTGIRLRNENRLLIFPERFSIAIAIAFSKTRTRFPFGAREIFRPRDGLRRAGRVLLEVGTPTPLIWSGLVRAGRGPGCGGWADPNVNCCANDYLST
jgi:hypothetical protein